MTPDVQATLLHRRSTSALVSRFILELAEPRTASGPEQGPVGSYPMVRRGRGRDHPEHEPDLLPFSPPTLRPRQEDRRRAPAAWPSTFGLDPTLVRAGFAISILFSGAGLVAYLLLLAIVPTDDATPAAAAPTAA